MAEGHESHVKKKRKEVAKTEQKSKGVQTMIWRPFIIGCLKGGSDIYMYVLVLAMAETAFLRDN